MQMIFDKEICGEKDHEKENEKYAGDIAFLGSSTILQQQFLIPKRRHPHFVAFIYNKESPQDVL